MCHGRASAVSGSRRWVSFVGLWSPVRERRFLLFCPRDLALGEVTDVAAVSGGGGDPGAVAATEGGWGELSGGVLVRVARGSCPSNVAGCGFGDLGACGAVPCCSGRGPISYVGYVYC